MHSVYWAYELGQNILVMAQWVLCPFPPIDWIILVPQQEALKNYIIESLFFPDNDATLKSWSGSRKENYFSIFFSLWVAKHKSLNTSANNWLATLITQCHCLVCTPTSIWMRQRQTSVVERALVKVLENMGPIGFYHQAHNACFWSSFVIPCVQLLHF